MYNRDMSSLMLSLGVQQYRWLEQPLVSLALNVPLAKCERERNNVFDRLDCHRAKCVSCCEYEQFVVE